MDWCYADKVLSVEDCELIAGIGKANLEEALTMGENTNPEVRQGSVCFFEPGKYPEAEPALRNLVEQFAQVVDWYWGYKLKDVKPIQLAFYKPGDFYEWHYDMAGNKEQSEQKFLKRHFSATVELTDPNTYEGGGLEFQGCLNNKPEKKQGRLIAFPSFMLHRARKVLAGERMALVMWAESNLFTELEPSTPLDMQQAPDVTQEPEQIIKAKVLDSIA